MFRKAQHWNLSPVSWFYPALWHPISPKYNFNNILQSVLHLLMAWFLSDLQTTRFYTHTHTHTHTHISPIRAVCPAHLVRVHNVFSHLILNDLRVWSNDVKWFNNKTSDLVWVCVTWHHFWIETFLRYFLLLFLHLLLLPGAELPSWKFWPYQGPLSTSLDPGRRLSSFFIFIWQMSCLMLFSHLYLGLPCDLLVRGFQLNIFVTVLVSGILCTWPNQLVFEL